MNRILVEASEVQDGRVLLSDWRAEHILKVLGGERDRVLRMGVINGPKGAGRIVDVGAGGIDILLELDENISPRSRVSLLLALPRPKVMKRLWAPLASLGVDQIVLLNAEKVEKAYWASHTLKESYYRPLLIEGLKQCGDTQLPEVQMVKAFRPFVEDELPDLITGANALLAYEGEASPFSSLLPLAQETSWLALGPEGGWNDFEVDLLKKAGFTPFSLGDRILRSDVACITALGLLHQFGKR